MAKKKRIFREWQHPRNTKGEFAEKGSAAWAARAFKAAEAAGAADFSMAQPGGPAVGRGSAFVMNTPSLPARKAARKSTFELGPKSKSASGPDAPSVKKMAAPGKAVTPRKAAAQAERTEPQRDFTGAQFGGGSREGFAFLKANEAAHAQREKERGGPKPLKFKGAQMTEAERTAKLNEAQNREAATPARGNAGFQAIADRAPTAAERGLDTSRASGKAGGMSTPKAQQPKPLTNAEVEALGEKYTRVAAERYAARLRGENPDAKPGLPTLAERRAMQRASDSIAAQRGLPDTQGQADEMDRVQAAINARKAAKAAGGTVTPTTPARQADLRDKARAAGIERPHDAAAGTEVERANEMYRKGLKKGAANRLAEAIRSAQDERDQVSVRDEQRRDELAQSITSLRKYHDLIDEELTRGQGEDNGGGAGPADIMGDEPTQMDVIKGLAKLTAGNAAPTPGVGGPGGYAGMKRHTIVSLARTAGIDVRGKSNARLAEELDAKDAATKAERAARLNPSGVGKPSGSYAYQGRGTPERIAHYQAMDEATLQRLAQERGLIVNDRSKNQLVDALADRDASGYQVIEVGKPAIEQLSGGRSGNIQRTEIGGWKGGRRPKAEAAPGAASGDPAVTGLSDERLRQGLQMYGTDTPNGRKVVAEMQRRGLNPNDEPKVPDVNAKRAANLDKARTVQREMRVDELKQSTEPKDNAAKIKAIVDGRMGSADLYRTAVAGPSGQRAPVLAGRVRHTPDNPSGEFRVVDRDGILAGWATSTVHNGRQVFAVHSENYDGETRLEGWADTLSHAADVLTHGEMAASSSSARNSDNARISGRLFERYEGRNKTVAELDREALDREIRQHRTALDNPDLTPGIRARHEASLAKLEAERRGEPAGVDTSRVKPHAGGVANTTTEANVPKPAKATPGEATLGVTESSRGRTTTVTLPDGTTAQRTSKSMAYTHAVVVTTDHRGQARDERAYADEQERFANALEAWMKAGADISKLERHKTGHLSMKDKEDGRSPYQYYLPGFGPVQVDVPRSRYGGGGTRWDDPNNYSLPDPHDNKELSWAKGQTEWERYGPDHLLKTARERAATGRAKADKLDAGPAESYSVWRWSQSFPNAMKGQSEFSKVRHTRTQIVSVGGAARELPKPTRVVPTAEEKAAAKAATAAAAKQRQADSDAAFVARTRQGVERAIAEGRDPEDALKTMSEPGLRFMVRAVGAKLPRQPRDVYGRSQPLDRDAARKAIVAAVRLPDRPVGPGPVPVGATDVDRTRIRPRLEGESDLGYSLRTAPSDFAAEQILAGHSAAGLRAIARDEKVSVTSKATKPQLIEALLMRRRHFHDAEAIYRMGREGMTRTQAPEHVSAATVTPPRTNTPAGPTPAATLTGSQLLAQRRAARG